MRVQTCTCEVFQSCDRCTTYVGGKRSEDDNKKVFQKNIQNDLSGINLVQVKEQNHKSTGKQKPPKEKHCRKLGYETFTERWCHAESRIIKFSVGGGIMGSKIPDDLTAWLSVGADAELSQPLPKDATQKQLEKHAKEWRRLIKLSH